MNSWHWDSLEQYKERVYPTDHAFLNIASALRFDAASKNLHTLFVFINGFDDAYQSLRQLLGGPIQEELSEKQVDEVCLKSTQLVYNAECIFAYCRSLTEMRGGQEFIARKEVSEHLPSYQKQNLGRKVKMRAQGLLEAAEQLATDIHDFFEGNVSFLKNVTDLPANLKVDFITARDLMSLGFDEAGLIFSGRGLEGVIRQIAKNHNVGKQPVERARFFDILTALETKRFSRDNSLVIDEGTKLLLQYSRTVRNNSAHPNAPGAKGYPEQAVLMAQTANDLWKKCAQHGVRLV
jgi:hypothetical protein